MRRNNLFGIALFLFIGLSNAQEILEVDEAVKLALQNNYGIQIAENNISKAENSNSILNKRLLPAVTANGAATYSNVSAKSTNTQGETFEINGAASKNYSAGLQLSYTLFDGFQRWYTNKNYEENLTLSELDARAIIESNLLQVYAGYYKISQLTENVQNQQEILQISQQRLERSSLSEGYGQVSKLEVLNAEVDVNNDSIQLLQLVNELANAKRDLNVLLGRDVNILFDTETEISFLNDLNKDDLIQNALEYNVNILQGKTQIRLGENLHEVNNGAWLPKLNLNSAYNWSLQDSDNPQQLFPEQRVLGFNAGLSLSWNIFNGGSDKIRKQNSEIDILNAKTNLEQNRQILIRNVENAWANYRNALFLIDVQRKNMNTNKRNFERTEQKFKLGQNTSIEFRQAQTNLLNAQSNYNKSLFDAKVSELQLLQLSGKLDIIKM